MKHVSATIMISLLSLTCTPVSSNCTVALSQDAPPIEPAEDDPPKSLDELLGIEEGSDEKESLLEKRDRKNLEDRLQERDIQSDLESAITDMSVAAEIIQKKSDVGLDLQRLQKSIIARLDAVIDEAKRRQQEENSASSSSSSSSSSSQESTSEPPSNSSSEESGGENTASEKNQTEGSGSDESEISNIVQAAPEGVLLEESDVEWGRLPERVREVIRQGMRESISRRYRSLTEAYYRRLAEEASQ